MAIPALALWLPLFDVAAGHASAVLRRPDRPHIVLLVLDDIGWADVGYHGSNFPTPNIDTLVKGGVELDRMYALPQCSPTRSAVMTGRWPWTIGLQHWNTIFPGSKAGLPHDVATLAEVMRSAGYGTHAIGKWHLGYSKESQFPTSRGFDSYLGYLQGEIDYYNRTIPTCQTALCLFRSNCKGQVSGQTCTEPMQSPYGPNAEAFDFWNGSELALQEYGRYTQHSYMSRFRQLLEPYNASAHPAPPKPLFLYFAQQLLHVPLQAPDDPHHLEACRGVRGGYSVTNRTVLCSMASKLDETIGEMVQLLKEFGMYENTLIWAYSDNGGMTSWGKGFPASASSNHPLRGGKTTLFEGGVRSVSWVCGGALPVKAQGTKRKELLHAVDILPTLAGLAGVKLSGSTLHGEDVWGTIVGAEGHITKRMELPLNIAMNRDLNMLSIPNWFTPHWSAANYTAVINWPWKLILGNSYLSIGQHEIVSRAGWWTIENYTYTPPPSASGAMLFHLETDEAEHYNVAEQFPDVVSNMTDRIYSWWLNKTSGYRMPQVNALWPQANPRHHKWAWTPFHLLEGEMSAGLSHVWV